MDSNFSRNAMLHLTNGLIEDIDSDRNNTLVTVSYTDCVNCNRRDQRVRLVVGNNTVIFNESGNRIRPRDLERGMIIDATFSSAMTRSIPPQATAYVIRVVRRPREENITEGRIVDVNRRNRNFTVIRDGRRPEAIQFNVTNDTRFFNSSGRPIDFSNLIPGLRVRVRHANFMTASIPPQTTAFEVRVIK